MLDSKKLRLITLSENTAKWLWVLGEWGWSMLIEADGFNLLFDTGLRVSATYNAAAMGVDARPFLVAVAVAASTCFITPVGYQTNTMVYSPGGYRFIDFARVGTPLNLIFFIVAVLLIPIIWHF